MKMRQVAVPLVLVAALAVGACGKDTAPGGKDQSVQQGSEGSGGLNLLVPSCPYTAGQVSEVLGQPMTDEGMCLFGDGRGVASLTITTASQAAGAASYDYQKEQASQRYGTVDGLGVGERSYAGSKDVTGEAVVLSKKGTYTLTLSNFSKDAGWYAQTLRNLAAALPL